MVEGRFFGRLWTGLQKTRQALTESLGAVFSRKRIDAETLEELVWDAGNFRTFEQLTK